MHKARSLVAVTAVRRVRSLNAHPERDEAPSSAVGLRNLVETVRRAEGLGTLQAAIEHAGLSEILARLGPYTVFAPSDDAFARLPEGTVEALLATPPTLADVVSYHVVPGRLASREVASRSYAATLQGEDLWISSSGAIQVDGAHVVRGDIEASNGVIHVIDRVLLPARI